MNYMEQVAQMLGVEIGEEFNIEGGSKDAKYKFSKDYLIIEITDVGWTRASFYLVDLLNGKLKIVKLPKSILTEKEKKYLSGVVEPFRDRVESIYKCSYTQKPFECIIIRIEDESSIILPNFKKNTMYKGMEPNKKYTLEELGL